MLIGIVGAPNKGKSTFFSAITAIEVDMADYPFTTIKPNIGVTYFTKLCPEKELGIKCKPKNSTCINGIRHIPITIVDVAGLVPGASLGKGMGNQFLNDLSAADALIHVVDISGKTDEFGNPTQNFDSYTEISMVRNELSTWLFEIIKKHLPSLSKRSDGISALTEMLSNLKATEQQVKTAAEQANLTLSYISWEDIGIKKFSDSFIAINKPYIVVANKLDSSSELKVDELSKKLNGIKVIGCSSEIELAIRKAAKSNLIEYERSSNTIKIIGKVDDVQRTGIGYIEKYLKKYNTTGVQEAINYVISDLLKMVVSYPVENENKYTDHFGNVLPDAIILNGGATALDLALHIHTDIAKKMLYAIDARSKNRVSKEYVLKDNDIIKIVTAAK